MHLDEASTVHDPTFFSQSAQHKLCASMKSSAMRIVYEKLRYAMPQQYNRMFLTHIRGPRYATARQDGVVNPLLVWVLMPLGH